MGKEKTNMNLVANFYFSWLEKKIAKITKKLFQKTFFDKKYFKNKKCSFFYDKIFNN